MIIEARWKITEEYFQSYYKDWIKFVSKGKRWSIPIGLTLILLGLVMIIFNKDNHIYSFAMLGFGISQSLWYLWEKHKWIKSMAAESRIGEEVSLTFNDEGITHSGPTSSGNLKWSGIKQIIQADQGLFLRLQKGICIYVPKSAIQGPYEIASILQLFKSGNA